MNPEELQERYELATDLYRQGRYAESLAIVDELVEHYPANPSLLHARALCLMKVGRLDAASETCSRLIKLSPAARGAGVQLMADIAARLADGETDSGEAYRDERPSSEDSLPEQAVVDSHPPVPTEYEVFGQPADMTAAVEESIEPASLRAPLVQTAQPEGEPERPIQAEAPSAEPPVREARRQGSGVLSWVALLLAAAGLLLLWRFPDSPTRAYEYFRALVPAPAPAPPVSAPPTVEPAPAAPAVDEAERGPQTVTFPQDRVLGRVFMRSVHAPATAPWEYWGGAVGEVVIPEDKHVLIEVDDCHWLELDTLADLGLRNLRGLVITNISLRDDALEPVVRLTNLEELALRHTFQVTDAGLHRLAALKRLRKLTLAGVNLASAEGFAFLQALVRLNELDVGDTPFGDASLAYLSGLDGLESLRLSDAVTDNGMRAAPPLPKLKRLALGGGVTSEGLDYVKSLPELEVLELKGAVTETGFSALAEAPRLRELVCYNRFDTRGFARLSACPALRRIHLVGVDLSQTLLDGLAAIPRLDSLVLEGTPLAAGVEATAAALLAMPSLKDLALAGSEFGNDLVAGLAQHPALESVRLAGAAATEAGVGALAGIPKLKRVTLEGETVSDAGLARLRDIKKLTRVDLVNVVATPESIAALGAALPDADVSVQDLYGGGRHVTFPPEGSKGLLYEGERVSPEAPQWRLTGRAVGRVRVPAGSALMLSTGGEETLDLSYLRQLRPNDLQALVIRSASVRDEDLAPVAALTGLEALTLVCRQVGDGAVPFIVKCRALRQLVFVGAAVSDASLAQLADSLPGLEVLGVAGCENVTDKGVRHIARLGSLQVVDLGGIRVTDAGVRHLHPLKTLRSINITGTDVSADGLVRLQEALPSCRITWDHVPTSGSTG